MITWTKGTAITGWLTDYEMRNNDSPVLSVIQWHNHISLGKAEVYEIKPYQLLTKEDVLALAEKLGEIAMS